MIIINDTLAYKISIGISVTAEVNTAVSQPCQRRIMSLLKIYENRSIDSYDLLRNNIISAVKNKL